MSMSKYGIQPLSFSVAEILDKLAEDYPQYENYAYSIGYKRCLHLPKLLPKLHPHRYLNWETERKVNYPRAIRSTVKNIEELHSALEAQRAMRRMGHWLYKAKHHEAILHAYHGEKFILEELENKGTEAA